MSEFFVACGACALSAGGPCASVPRCAGTMPNSTGSVKRNVKVEEESDSELSCSSTDLSEMEIEEVEAVKPYKKKFSLVTPTPVPKSMKMVDGLVAKNKKIQGDRMLKRAMLEERRKKKREQEEKEEASKAQQESFLKKMAKNEEKKNLAEEQARKLDEEKKGEQARAREEEEKNREKRRKEEARKKKESEKKEKEEEDEVKRVRNEEERKKREGERNESRADRERRKEDVDRQDAMEEETPPAHSTEGAFKVVQTKRRRVDKSRENSSSETDGEGKRASAPCVNSEKNLSSQTKNAVTAPPSTIRGRFIRQMNDAVKEIRDYCFNDKNKINKPNANAILEKVDSFQNIIIELIAVNSESVGKIHALSDLLARGGVPPRSTQSARGGAPPTGAATRLAVAKEGGGVPARADSGLAEAAGGAWRPASGRTQAANQRPPKTFASILAGGRRRAEICEEIRAIARERPKIHSVRITAIEGSEPRTAEDVTKIIKSSIDPRKSGISISSLRSTRDNAVIIETASEADVDKLIKSDEFNKAGLHVRQNRGADPRMIVRSVPSDMTAEELCAALRGNDLLESPETRVRICHQTGRRGGPTAQWVVEVDPESRKLLLGKGRVYLGWSCGYVDDFVESSRCYNCQAHGHIAKLCKSVERCAHCAKDGHSIDKCPSKNEAPKCVNCVRSRRANVSHPATSFNCPCHLVTLEWRVSRINYG